MKREFWSNKQLNKYYLHKEDYGFRIFPVLKIQTFMLRPIHLDKK